MDMQHFEKSQVPYKLLGVSALEKFFGMSAGPYTTVEADAGLADLARLFDRISFPGLPSWDALVPNETGTVLIRTADDSTDEMKDHPLLQFSWDPMRRAFSDPHDLYPLLKEARNRLRAAPIVARGDATEPVPVGGLNPLEAAVVCSRFPFLPEESPGRWRAQPAVPPEYHRIILEQVLTGVFAWRGLEILKDCGYIDEVFPELTHMDETEQSKEGHPEGNVWRHTVETLRYRKTMDLRVGLALLLHDSGKPFAEARGERRFDRHAEIGADLATRILRRTGFADDLIQDVRWLITRHMIPGALERLPDHRRNPVMASPLFPFLLEVYRCDLSSTYRGPDGYYRACKVYRRYVKKNRSNGSWAQQDEQYRRRIRQLVD